MMKFFSLSILIVLILNVSLIENCRTSETASTVRPLTTRIIGSIKRCPRPQPAANFDLSQALGTWYNYVASRSIVPPGERCTKLEFSQPQADQVRLDITLLADGSADPLSFFNTQTINAATPGVFSQSRTIRVLDLAGNQVDTTVPITLTVLYADSDYVLRYGCGEYTNYTSVDLLEFYFLAKRSRSSDSLAQAWPILNLLKDVPTNLNNAVFIPNDASCTL